MTNSRKKFQVVTKSYINDLYCFEYSISLCRSASLLHSVFCFIIIFFLQKWLSYT